MNRLLSLVLAAFFCSTLFAQETTDAAKAPRVELAGLKVILKTTGKGFDGLRPFNSERGAEIALLVSHPDKGLIAFDKDKSKLELFSDDQGKALCKSIGFMEGWGNFPQIEKDGSAVLVEVAGRIPPSPKARALRVRGELALLRATKVEQARLENFKAQKGESLKVGPFDFKIQNAGKPDWGSGVLQLSLSIDRDIPEVKTIRFLDGDGKAIETRDGGTSRSSALDTVFVSRSYILERTSEKLSIEIDYYSDMALIKVPVNLDVHIGGGSPGTEAKPEEKKD